MNDLLDFAAYRQPQWQSFLVCSLVDEICESLESEFVARGVELDIDVPTNTVLTADREMLRRAILNLVQNALDAMPQGGQLVITSFESNCGLEIEVADSGPGLSEEAKMKVLGRFYATRQSGQRDGLPVVFRIMQAHSGTVTAANCPEGGAAFTLRIPHRRAIGVAA